MAQIIVRIVLAIGFLLPVSDRLGIMGGPGTKNVAWGNWANFVDYTNQLIPFIPGNLANVAAIIASASEVILAIGLLVGYKTKCMGLGTAILTATFGIFMFFSLGPLAPFVYPVFVFTGAGLMLWEKNDFKWSVDAILKK